MSRRSVPGLPGLLALVVLLLGLSADSVSALMYAFTNSDRICFIEEISVDDFSITGHYDWQEHPDKSIKIELVLYGPDQSLVTSHSMKHGVNVFSMSLGRRLLGPYKLCAEVVSVNFNPTAEPPLFVDFDVDQTKATAIEQEKHETSRERVKREVVDGLSVFTFTDAGGQAKTVLQPRELLEMLENELQQISNGITAVMDGLTHFSSRQRRMRMTSESTFRRVWLCATVTLLSLAIVVWIQDRMLKATIVKKKLI